MNPELNDLIHVMGPENGTVDGVTRSDRLTPFNDEVIEFVSSLSTQLLRDSRTKSYPEVVAMAFWLRKASIVRLRDDFLKRSNLCRLPRGLAFHIAPSNVDTIFIYSLFLSMFAGNGNIVRLSSQSSDQVSAIVAVLNEQLSLFPTVAGTVLLVRYEHNDSITQMLSSVCDVRIIWGGDETIRRIRAIGVPPHAKELTFADRFSMAIIDVMAYLNQDPQAKEKLTGLFYNDSYWFGQMACSSPRLVCWVGGDKAQVQSAQQLFWDALERCISQQHPDIAAASVMDKYVAQCTYAVEMANTHMPRTQTNLVSRIAFSSDTMPRRDLHCGNGLFLETTLAFLDELLPLITRKDQTITAFGFSSAALTTFLQKHIPKGIDRIVPFGQALNFSPVWDGYDLLFELTRAVVVET